MGLFHSRRDSSSPDRDDLAELDVAAAVADDDAALLESDEPGRDRGFWTDVSGPTPAGLRRPVPDPLDWYELTEPDPHVTSTHQAPVLVPALMHTGWPFAGWPIGMDSHTGLTCACDQYLLYELDVIQSLSAVVIGDVGQAKSTLVKVHYVLDQLALGRKSVVFDRKRGRLGQASEYERSAQFAEASGQRVSRIVLNQDGGARINILDPYLLSGEGSTTVGQEQLLEMVIRVATGGAGIGSVEWGMLNTARRQAQAEAQSQGRDPTLRDLSRALFCPDPVFLPADVQAGGRWTADRMAEAGERIGWALQEAITGSLAGLIDGPTCDQHGRPLELDADLLMIDTSALTDGSPALALMMTMLTTYLDAVWASQQSRGVAVIEEGYSADLPAVGNILRELAKRGRNVGVSLVFVLHHFSDIPADSPLSALYREAGIVHIFKQDKYIDARQCAETLGVEELIDTIQGLGKGEHLLFEGDRSKRPPRRISNTRTDAERWITDTDDAITDRERPASPLPPNWRDHIPAAGGGHSNGASHPSETGWLHDLDANTGRS